MKFKKINNHFYLIRLERGEKIIASLESFCQKQKIAGGFSLANKNAVFEKIF